MAKKEIISFLATLISIILLDFIVISSTILPLYNQNLFGIIKEEISIISSISAWIIISFGISYFITPNSKNNKQSFKNGALLGLVIYGVYDLTNYAIISGWTIGMTIIDIIWGMLLCGTVSVINKYVNISLK